MAVGMPALSFGGNSLWGNTSFALEVNAIYIFQGCLLYKHPHEYSLSWRTVSATLPRQGKLQETHSYKHFPNIIVIGLQFFKICPENTQVYIGENMS